MLHDIDPHRLPDLARVSELGELLVASDEADRRSARVAGWKSGLLGPWDDGDGAEAGKTPATGEWRVRFHHTWSDWPGGDEPASTGSVGFDRRTDGIGHEAPLADVPPLVFSEAMRDVDLFVGVTSIAADPDWREGGPERA